MKKNTAMSKIGQSIATSETTFFCQNLLNFTKSARNVLDNFFAKDSLDELKRCRQGQGSIFSGRWSKTQNGGQNRIYPS